VMAIFKSNVANVKTLLQAAIPRIASREWADIIKERQDAVKSNIVNHSS